MRITLKAIGESLVLFIGESLVFFICYLLVGIYNSATIFEFLNVPNVLGLVIVSLVALIWGAPYYSLSRKQLPGRKYSINKALYLKIRAKLYALLKEKSDLYSHDLDASGEIAAVIKDKKLPKSLVYKLQELIAEAKSNNENYTLDLYEEQYNDLVYETKLYADLKGIFDDSTVSEHTGEEEAITKSTSYKKFIYVSLMAVGFSNILISPIGRVIGGHEIVSSQLTYSWEKIVMIFAIIAGIACWILNFKAVEAFATSILQPKQKVQKVANKYIPKTNKPYGIIISLLSLTSVVVGAFLINAYPALYVKILIAVILWNLICFSGFVWLNKKSKQPFAKALKKSSTYFGLGTSLAVAAYAAYAGYGFSDVVANAFLGHAISSPTLNTVIAIASLLVTLVTSYSFFALFSFQSINEVIDDIDVNRVNRKLLDSLSDDTGKNQLLSKVKKYNAIYFSAVFIMALLPSVCMVFMAYGSIMPNLLRYLNYNVSQFFSIFITAISTYLSFMFFVYAASDFLKTFVIPCCCFSNQAMTKECRALFDKAAEKTPSPAP